jgi:lipid II:glycine glycyltransferase (peptidoglycan interpeptide bridge formation enzyme)
MTAPRLVTDREAWDTALLGLPDPQALQTWDWGAFKERWGWQADRWVWEREGRPAAAAQVLQRRLGGTPFTLAYVPRGPLLDFGDGALLTVVLSDLEALARRRQHLCIKIDPAVRLGMGAETTAPEPTAEEVLAELSKRGWRLSTEQIQFKNTVLVDLTPGESDLLARMKPKTRYNIRLAERRGVTVRRGDLADLAAFYGLYQTTSQRDGFLIRPFAYYRDVWTQFLNAGRGHLLLADLAAETIAGLLLFVVGPTAWYMYGASSDAHREHMPSHLLQWHAMQLARAAGCTNYDMWGAPDQFAETDRMWGVYRFKAGFGGETVRGLGAYDFAPRPLLYRLYSWAMPIILAAMRRRHRLAGPATLIAC